MSTPSYTYNDQHLVTSESWRLQGNYHRVDGPAYRSWEIVNCIPVLTIEIWFLEGNRHRVDGPAVREWKIVNGLEMQHPVLILEQWMVEGQYHRLDGPAWRGWEVVRDDVRVLSYEDWWLRDIMIEDQLLPSTALTLQRWFRCYQQRRWHFIEQHLLSSGLIVFPGLIHLLRSY